MAENFLQTAAKSLGSALYGQESWLGKLLNKRKPSKPQTMTGTNPTPVYMPPSPSKSFIGMDDPQIQELMGGIQQAQGVMSRPMPKPQEAKADPLEQLLSVVLAGTNKFAAGKTLDVPNQLAQQRADSANQQTFGQYKIDRENAEGQINTNTKLIDMALDRDAVTERVSGMLRKSELSGIARLEVEKLKTNKDLIKVFAKLGETGGITVPAVTAIYLQMGYAQDEAEAIAEQAVRAAPSLKVQIDMAKQETASLKQRKDAEDDFWDNLESDNLSVTQRFRLINEAKKDGIIPPEVDAMAMAKELGPKGQLMQEKAETEDATRKGKVDEIGKKIEKIESSIAKDWAQVEKWKSDTAQRGTEFEWKKRHGGAPSSLDNKLATLRLAKEDLLAQAEEWHDQMPEIFGREVQTANGQSALQKIQRSIAGIDAKLKMLKGMGAKEVNVQVAPAKVDFGGLQGPITPQGSYSKTKTGNKYRKVG